MCWKKEILQIKSNVLKLKIDKAVQTEYIDVVEKFLSTHDNYLIIHSRMDENSYVVLCRENYSTNLYVIKCSNGKFNIRVVRKEKIITTYYSQLKDNYYQCKIMCDFTTNHNNTKFYVIFSFENNENYIKLLNNI